MVTITSNNLKFRFDQSDVIWNINCTFEGGSIFNLYGDNGSGKSTISKLLCNILNGFHGDIYINNINYRDINPNDRRNIFIYIPQEPRWLFLKNSLSSTLELLKVSNINYDLVNNYFSFDVHNLINKSINDISLDEMYLLIFIEIIIWERRVMIFDELPMFDDDHMTSILKKILQHRIDRNFITIFTSHSEKIDIDFDYKCINVAKYK